MGTIKYIYCKVMSATHNKVKLFADKEGLLFLKQHHINHRVDENNYIIIDKNDFLQKLAA